MTLTKWILLFIGGGFGAWTRIWISGMSFWSGYKIPVHTLLINLMAGFILGYATMAYRKTPDQYWIYYFIMAGFCGALSTFSSFSAENFNLLQESSFGWFVIYVLLSVLLCLLSYWLGTQLHF